jgi:thioredoxin-related protein
MNFVFFTLAFLGFCSSFSSSVSASPNVQGAKNMSQKNLGLGAPWQTGNVQTLLKKAQKNNRNSLLYWGAVWCPPCNELKSQVFQKPEFLESTQNIDLIYLDGDSPQAQVWADKLKVSGYPSLLLLSPQGLEISRFDGSFAAFEFISALKASSALTASVQELSSEEPKSFSQSQWRAISTFTWEDPALKIEKLHKTLWRFYENVPAELFVEKALLAAKIFSVSLDLEKENADYKNVQQKADILLNSIFLNPETQFACRSFLLNSAPDVVNLVSYEFSNKNEYFKEQGKALKEKWLAAMNSLRDFPSISADTYLWSFYPEVVFEGFLMTEKEIAEFSYSQQLKQKILNAVDAINASSTSVFVRKSVIPGSASLLAKIGEFEKGRNILQQELVVSDTPWYIQSSMGELENKQGNTQEALSWFELAANSSKGASTKLQWKASYVSQLAKVTNKEFVSDDKFQQAVNSYYVLAFKTPDAFFGRNYGRQQKLAQILSERIKNQKIETKSLQKKLISFSKKCAAIKITEGKNNCLSHFQSIPIQGEFLSNTIKKNLK